MLQGKKQADKQTNKQKLLPFIRYKKERKYRLGICWQKEKKRKENEYYQCVTKKERNKQTNKQKELTIIYFCILEKAQSLNNYDKFIRIIKFT